LNRNASELAPLRRQLLQRALEFKGAPNDFWQLLTQSVQACLAGELAILYMLTAGDESGERWQPLSQSPGLPGAETPALAQTLAPGVLGEARHYGVAGGVALNGPWRIAVASIAVDAGQRELVLVVHLGAGGVADSEARQWLTAFRMAPQFYETSRARQTADRDALRLAHALELLGRVLEIESFDQAALAVVNDLAERFACETVSLSWRAGEGLRLRAISHAEKVDRRSELSALLEEAGQEALVQTCEITWPNLGKQVARAHQHYAELQQPGHLITLPLLRPMLNAEGATGRHLGAITLERQRMPFSAAEQWALRMLCDLLLMPLQHLELRSQPLARRLVSDIWRSIPDRLKPATDEGRRLARGLGIAAALIMVLPLPYAVDAGSIVKTDAMAFVGAPFDGYLESSAASLGASVKAGEVMFTLATRELMLERASILADMAQYAREAEKRRTANQLPEMQIAEAQAAQAQAKLSQVEHRLESASARSPIDGVVVEGEPGKNLGGAVRRGDVIVKVAALSQLYIEAALRERDLSRVEVGQGVRVSLLADPGSTYAMKVTRIIPAAAVKDGENTFPVRIELDSSADHWWRPGMSGVARIDVGFRPLIWIASHRLVDYLRLALWY
jgi:biotin carboxyl carrier protein